MQSDQFHEVWAYLRDNAKPVQPHDVYDLRVVREQEPPSKAHIKRLTRERPVVVIARRKAPADTSARAHQIEAVNLGRKVRKMLQPNKFAPAAPKPYTRPMPRPPMVSAPKPIDPESGQKRMKRQHILAMCGMVYTRYVPKEADVVWAFGSWEAFEKARETK